MAKRGFLYAAAAASAAGLAITAWAAAGQWRLVGSETAQGDEYGFANAIDGDTVVVGAPYADSPGIGFRSGEAYVYVRQGAAWTQQARLLAYDQIANQQFGTSVAIGGNTAVVGAIQDSQAAASAGALYVFERSAGNWTQALKLVADDAAPGDNLGETLEVEGDTLVSGVRHRSEFGSDSGAVYVFQRSGSSWPQAQKIVPADGALGDHFGTMVALDGDTLVVGAPYAGPSHSGAAYVYVRSGGTWTLEQKLEQTGTPLDQAFGYAVALSGDTVVVGAPDRDNGLVDPGAAYVFVRSGGVWTEQQRIAPADPTAHARFGRFVGVSGDAAVIASPLDDDAGADAGAVYVYKRAGGSWAQFKKIEAVDGRAGDKFGLFLAMSGITVVSGAPLHDDPAEDAGSSYVLEEVTTPGSPGPGPGPGPDPGPGPIANVDSFLVPQKVTAKPTSLTATGFLNTGVAATGLGGAARFDVDGLDIVIPNLSRKGKVLRYSGPGVSLVLTPSKVGSSQTKFSLRYAGAVSGNVLTDGLVGMQFRGATAQGAASLNLAGGKFALGKAGARLVSPTLYVIKTTATLGGAGADSLSATLGFAGDGVIPAAPSELEIGFGGADVVIPASSFVAKGAGFEFVGNVGGVTKVKLDYAKGTIAVTGKGMTLGDFAFGGNEVPVKVRFGADQRQVRVLMARAGSKLRY
jgi:hypothetical protein